MTNVYIVTTGDSDDYTISAVFTDAGAASEYARRLQEVDPHSGANVEDHLADEPLPEVVPYYHAWMEVGELEPQVSERKSLGPPADMGQAHYWHPRGRRPGGAWANAATREVAVRLACVALAYGVDVAA